jgi:alpha-L-rhamnosidase
MHSFPTFGQLPFAQGFFSVPLCLTRIHSHANRSIPTDCPQREKRGWMGDAHMSSSELNFNLDGELFHTNFLQLIRDDQLRGCWSSPQTSRDTPCDGQSVMKANGSVPDVTPYSTSPYGSFPGAPVWESALVVITRNLWK